MYPGPSPSRHCMVFRTVENIDQYLMCSLVDK